VPKRRSPSIGLAFNHAMIYVRNVEPALRFYRDRLGFRLIEQFPRRGRAAYARLRATRGNATIALHLLGEGVTSTKSAGVRLYFETRHLDRLCRRLAASGVRFKQKPRLMPWGWTHAYLDDPDGHEVSLYWAAGKRLRKSRM